MKLNISESLYRRPESHFCTGLCGITYNSEVIFWHAISVDLFPDVTVTIYRQRELFRQSVDN